jgi:recombinational DNA repair ATPase RecF
LKERESFAGISQEFYQDFFKKRVNTYQKLLNQKNQYITKMEEEFLTDELENWGIVYHSAYTSIRKLIIENQLYISNELDKLFNELRKSASEYIKEADLVEANNYSQNNPSWEDETLNAVYDKFAKNTLSMMNAVLEQITLDVSKLRSRIEID